MATVLVLFDSRGGLVQHLAEAVAEGVREVAGAEVSPRRLDEADPRELLDCDALILGSPNWSGMTGKLKEWFDYSGDLWQTGELAGKPGPPSPPAIPAREASRRRCSSCSTCCSATG